jgi:hypothetical protein
LSLKTLAVFLAFLSFFFVSASAADDINIYLKASPRLELLYPYSDPATLTLLVTGTDGKPVAQGRVAIRLEAPEPGWFFSTDFPLVEGSRLLEMGLPLRQGRAEWKYLFPIRGQYRLTVEFVAPDGRKVNKTFPLAIRENKQKWFFLGIFTMGLFALGVMAGRIFTSSRSSRGGQPAVGLVLLLGSFMGSIDTAIAQEAEKRGDFGWLEIDPATVGKLSTVRWRFSGEEKAEGRAVLLNLTIAHLKKGKPVFAVESPRWKEFAMSFQFPTGGVSGYGIARHRRTNDPNRAKHIRHWRGTPGAGNDSSNRTLSSRDSGGIGSGSMEPPRSPILTQQAGMCGQK